MSTDLRTDEELDQHIRRTLRTVADAVDARPATEPLAVGPTRTRPRRRTLIGLGVVAAALPAGAAALYGVGPEYVDEMPPDDVIVAGSADGQPYSLVEAFHTDGCGDPVPGVELLREDGNIVGQEWNSLGFTYGGYHGGCTAGDPVRLGDPARWRPSGTFVGDTFVAVIPVHPDVTELALTMDGTEQRVAVHPVDGAGYAVYEVPETVAVYSGELLIDGDVVPGSTQQVETPEPRD